MAAVSAADLALPPPAEGSAEMAARVAAARAIQTARYAGEGARTNAEAAGKMRLSARGYTRVLRVARTVADLAGAGTVGRPHVAEALGYRRRPPVN